MMSIEDQQKITDIITIVTPFYNTHPDIFIDTVNSILNQSFTSWIWKIINDGSTDTLSLKYIVELASQDDRIQIVHHESNKGLSAARNTGINSARTPYIFLIDSDDTINSLALEKFYWFLESNKNFHFVNSYTVGFGAKDYLWREGFHNGHGFIKRNPVIPTALFRTSLFEKTGGYDESMNEGLEDWDFWLKCAANAKWGFTIPEFLTGYRTRENHEDKWNNWNDKGLSHFRKLSQKKYPGLTKKTFPIIKRLPYKINGKIEWNIKEYSIQPSSKPSILFIIPWMKIGGADQFNINIISKLYADFNIIVICTLEAEHLWQKHFEECAHAIFILPNFLHPGSYGSFLSTLIQTHTVGGIFLSNSAFGYMILPYIKSRHPAIKIIDYCHIEESWREGGYPKYSINYGAHIDRQFVSSEYLKNWMINKGTNIEKIVTLYIGVDAAKYTPNSVKKQEWRQLHKIEEECTLIVFAGRLSSQKQPDILIRTAKELSIVSSDFKLIIIGDGPDQKIITQGIKKYNLEGYVEYLGALSNQQVKEWMNAAEIFFLPSAHEGIALSIYEAMALSCAIVGANVGGQSELVDEDVGTLINIGNSQNQIEQYTNVLSNLISNPQIAIKKGIKGRRRIEEYFSVQKTADRIITEFTKQIKSDAIDEHPDKYKSQARLAIEAYQSILDLSTKSILDEERVQILKPANDQLIVNNGAIAFFGSLLKKCYNYGLNTNHMLLSKSIKKMGLVLAKVGIKLINIDD